MYRWATIAFALPTVSHVRYDIIIIIEEFDFSMIHDPN